MRVAIDAFGGDNAPLEVMKGCVLSKSENKNLNIFLIGDEEKIKKIASENDVSIDSIDIIDAPDVLRMEDEASEILKSKRQSSMAKGFDLLKEGAVDVFLSAGNSGSMLVGSTFLVGRIKGVKRCSFAPIIPSGSNPFMLIDSGANVECRPSMLLEFGKMGSLYMQRVVGIKNPTVALANIGTEGHKGTDLYVNAFRKLKESGLNFIGNIEARDIPFGKADVVVADGFTGNMILKTYEGVASVFMGKMKEIFKANLKGKIAASLIMSELKKFKSETSQSKNGGAPILGCQKAVFKIHGNSKAKTFKNAIEMAVSYKKNNVIEKIGEAL